MNFPDFFTEQRLTRNEICSLVIDTICEQARRNGGMVLFFYCNDQTKKDQSAVNIIGCLLRQCLVGAAGIPKGIRSEFDKSGEGCRKGL